MLGAGEGVLDSRFVGCSSLVCAVALFDVLLDFRRAALAVSFVFSPVPSTVSLVFSPTVSTPSLIFSPAFFAQCFMSWAVPSCPNAASAPAASKARTRFIIFMASSFPFSLQNKFRMRRRSRACRAGELSSGKLHRRLRRAARSFVNRREHRG